ncbi:unnamed protein product [Rodentolepis nana]|uniref:Annexin n=1 Tax=Rodentolepis nana TaxID=102285 RepID=A0A0R3TWJ2_RODNA|nr:unnamed protein product [Rodentolepis nana]
MGGYPPQGQMGGYPPQGQMGGYAPQGPMGQPGHVGPVPPGQMGYPPRGPMGCIPPGSMGGYPHHGQPSTQIALSRLKLEILLFLQSHFNRNIAFTLFLVNPYYLGRPTVQPSTDFNASDDSQALYKAMKGLGTNESAIIKILSKRTFEQRKEIAQSFKSSFGKDLDKSLMSEISGKFERVVLLSLKGLPGLLASSMSAAIKGAGTNETILLQCIIPFQNAIIKETAQVYDRTTGHKLEADIRNDTSGDFQKILIAMIQGTRDESTNVDLNMVNADAQRLYKAGEGKVGTEEAVFTQIFAQRSFAHIKALSQVYEQQFKTPLVKAIKKETSSDYEDALVAIGKMVFDVPLNVHLYVYCFEGAFFTLMYTLTAVKFAEDKTALLAEWLYTSMRGAGTDDESLILLVYLAEDKYN